MPVLITLTGGTASGKTTLAAALRARGVPQVVTTTTRAPRPGEVPGESYHFLSAEQFGALAAAGGFLETNVFGGESYGVSKAAVAQALKQSNMAVVIADPNGARAIHEAAPGIGVLHVGIWVECLVLVQLRRLTERELPVEELFKRLRTLATTEAEWEGFFSEDACHAVVNGSGHLSPDEMALQVLRRVSIVLGLTAQP